MTPKTLSVYVGETKKVVAKVSPDNADDKTVTWDSGHSNLVNVVDGSVTGVKAGKVNISAKADGKSAVCEVTILEPIVNPKSVTVAPTSVTVDVGKTQALNATVLPVNTTDKKVNWKSENIAIATVSPTGVVTGVAVPKEEGQAQTFVVGTTQASPNVTVRVPVTVTKVPEVPEVKKEE